MKEPEQWAVKQHLEKYPDCEWLCMHTRIENLGEELPRMEIYKPSDMPYYIVESDSVSGDKWFAHYNTFTNVVESNEVSFGSTPQEALQKFIDSRVKATKDNEEA